MSPDKAAAIGEAATRYEWARIRVGKFDDARFVPASDSNYDGRVSQAVAYHLALAEFTEATHALSEAKLLSPNYIKGQS